MKLLKKQYLSHENINCTKKNDTIVIRRGDDNGFFLPGLHYVNKSFEKFSFIDIAFDLGKISNWRILLDECLYISKDHSLLKFRFNPTKFVSLYVLMNFIFQYSKFNGYDIELQSRDSDLYCFEINKNNYIKEPDKSWTFGLLYNSEKNNNLSEFIKSIRKAFSGKNINYEIIIVSKNSPDLEPDSHIRWVAYSDKFDYLGPISTKKNIIAENALYENIAIFHNRYSISSDWVSIFDKFGYDFQVLSGKQILSSGADFPSWVALGTRDSYSKGFILNDDEFHPFLYVNGGVIICKKKILRDCEFNKFLFWNQCEDVEWSRRLISAGITPRYIPVLIASVLSHRNGYMDGFKKRNKFVEYCFGYPICMSDFNPLMKKIRKITSKFRK